MKLYHGTTEEYETFDLSKSREFGFCFTPQVEAARCYGEIIYTVELNIKNEIDLRKDKNIKYLCSLVPSLEQAILEEAYGNTELNHEYDESLEDAIESVGISVIQDAGLNDEDGNCIRLLILKAIYRAGYDCVIIEDYTDGDAHDTYIALNTTIIKKLN